MVDYLSKFDSDNFILLWLTTHSFGCDGDILEPHDQQNEQTVTLYYIAN